MNKQIPLLALNTLTALGVTSVHGLKSLNLVRSRLPGILMDSFSAFRSDTSLPAFPADITGMTVTRGDARLILYRDGMRPERINFTIAHELGHLVLHHTETTAAAERDADFFAESLLIPSSVVLLLERKTGLRLLPDDLLRYFPVSRSVCVRKRRELDSPLFVQPEEEEMKIAETLFEGSFSLRSFDSREESWLSPENE